MQHDELKLLSEFVGWMVRSYGSYELGSKTAGKINRPSLTMPNTFPYVIKNDDDEEDDEEDDDIL
jgi:hypothetical protein